MIPVAPKSEPATFAARVRQPGLRAIAEMCGKKPPFKRTKGQPFKRIANSESEIRANEFPTYWTEALDDLMSAYGEICAYSCFRIHPVTGARSADHFAAKSRAWNRVYEWDNYRLCCSRMNARKNDFADIIDPFEIQPGWFQLELLGFQVVPAPELNDTTRLRVQQTIDRLGLNSFRRLREQDAERYWSGDVSLKVLTSESPFVASELRRQGRLHESDV